MEDTGGGREAVVKGQCERSPADRVQARVQWKAAKGFTQVKDLLGSLREGTCAS